MSRLDRTVAVALSATIWAGIVVIAAPGTAGLVGHIWLVAVLALALATAACGPQPMEEVYPAKIAAIRAAKDDSFKSDPDSPIPPDKKTALIPLAYYPIDEIYAVPASLEPSVDRSRIEVPTSISKIRQLGHACRSCLTRAMPLESGQNASVSSMCGEVASTFARTSSATAR